MLHSMKSRIRTYHSRVQYNSIVDYNALFDQMFNILLVRRSFKYPVSYHSKFSIFLPLHIF